MVTTRPLISNSSSLFINLFVPVPSAPIIIGITVTFMSHSFSVFFQGLGTYPSFRDLPVLLCGLLEL